MEIRYPILILLIPCCVLLILKLIKKKNVTIEKDSSKIANTSYIQETDYYKKKVKEYNFIKILSYSSFIVMIISATFLAARPTKIERKELSKYNRDIILCMDVSSSVDELNLALVKSLKETVSKLKGERFGISIFNTSSVVLVPLTDDYDYVTSVLDTIYESITVNNTTYNYKDIDKYFYIKNYILSGTLEGSKERGSSLIGDGLASCVYNFSNMDDDRTRLIIFSTDNELEGTPLVTLNDAAKISKEKKIKVFGIGTKNMKSKEKNDFSESVLLTGGKFYEHSTATVDNIVDDIEKTSKSLLKSQTETKRYDMPELSFFMFLISFALFLFSSRKVIS